MISIPLLMFLTIKRFYLFYGPAWSMGFPSVVQSLSHVFVTPWTAAHQAFLSFTISQSLLKLMSIESVMPSNHIVLCHPLLLLLLSFPSISVFPISQLFASGGQSIGASASASDSPSGALVKNPPSNAREVDSIPAFPGEGNDNHSCLGNPMNRRA